MSGRVVSADTTATHVPQLSRGPPVPLEKPTVFACTLGFPYCLSTTWMVPRPSGLYSLATCTEMRHFL